MRHDKHTLSGSARDDLTVVKIKEYLFVVELGNAKCFKLVVIAIDKI